MPQQPEERLSDPALSNRLTDLAAALTNLVQTPDSDVQSVVEAIVRPAAELAESGWRGRAFLLIVAELAQEEPASLGKEVNEMLARTEPGELHDYPVEVFRPTVKAH